MIIELQQNVFVKWILRLIPDWDCLKSWKLLWTMESVEPIRNKLTNKNPFKQNICNVLNGKKPHIYTICESATVDGSSMLKITSNIVIFSPIFCFCLHSINDKKTHSTYTHICMFVLCDVCSLCQSDNTYKWSNRQALDA